MHGQKNIKLSVDVIAMVDCSIYTTGICNRIRLPNAKSAAKSATQRLEDVIMCCRVTNVDRC